jgi:hypothetical protein
MFVILTPIGQFFSANFFMQSVSNDMFKFKSPKDQDKDNMMEGGIGYPTLTSAEGSARMRTSKTKKFKEDRNHPKNSHSSYF